MRENSASLCRLANFSERPHPADGASDGPATLRDYTHAGRLIPWRQQKLARYQLAAAYDRLGPEFSGLTSRMRLCGQQLEFERYYVPDRPKDMMRLSRASFCRARLCPGCQGRLARKQHYFLCEVVGEHLKRRPGDVALMLTLTMRNVVAGQLGAAIDQLLGGFRKLMRRKAVTSAVIGWYRTLEVTRNVDTGELHPHLHILLIVPRHYFQATAGLYVEHAKWVDLWRACLNVEYAPIVDIRRVDHVGGGDLEDAGRGSLTELTKYVTKIDLIDGADGAALHDVHAALKGRRLVSMSASLRALADDLGLADPESDDNDSEMSVAHRLPDGAIYLGREFYAWNERRGDYVLTRLIPHQGGADEVAVIRNE